MGETPPESIRNSNTASGPPTDKPERHRWRWILLTLLVLALAGAIGVSYVISHALPILRARIIETLSTRFKSKIELPDLDVSLVHGLAVEGKDLKIFSETNSDATVSGIEPIIAVQEFRFRTGFRNLFHSPMHVDIVHVKGMVVNIPHRERPTADQPGPSANHPKSRAWQTQSAGALSIIVDRLVFDDVQVVIKTRTAAKPPTILAITHLEMKNVGPGLPMPFNATLINPRPVGNIHSQGQFGPFQETEPRDTPVSGNYSFTHADLSTFKGISGLLSSTGSYAGTLGRIAVNGETDTPDFRLERSGHAVALHTDFHAIVDGTDGDTYLQPVTARFLESSFTAKGEIVRTADPHGHDLELDVVMDHARIQDLLQLGVKTEPPVMSGAILMNAKVSLPPGPQDVADRLNLSGKFRIIAGLFSNDKIQDRVNDLSLRAQGKPQLVKQEGDVNVPSDLNGTFQLDKGLMTFSQLRFLVPGVESDIHGQYSLDGNIFDFHGLLKLHAKLSQLTTGWKSMLLKPIDPFFSKNGAGTEIPFRVTGTRSEPHFGLDFGHKDEQTEPKADPQSTTTK
jgi:hypothetical protein